MFIETISDTSLLCINISFTLIPAAEAAQPRLVESLDGIELVAIQMGPFHDYQFVCAHAASQSPGDPFTNVV